ncbi:hypothetical protein [Streptomyces sp. NBC_00203]|uniref:hypothetical protein n=1 Tax=Streptomyces sp. NBC_00203 TaxID=2975680 RepID=UPI0032567BA3
MTDIPRVAPTGDPTTTPSLRAYLGLYATGLVAREQMIATVASWPFEAEEEVDEGHTEPSHQDNTMLVVASARLLGQLTREDVEEIQRRIDRADRTGRTGRKGRRS